MANCTQCGYPNEYQESDYLCSQCKIMSEVFGGVTTVEKEAVVSSIEPEKVVGGKIQWTSGLYTKFYHAAKGGSHERCDTCGNTAGAHSSGEALCPNIDPDKLYADTTFYNDTAAEFVKNTP